MDAKQPFVFSKYCRLFLSALLVACLVIIRELFYAEKIEDAPTSEKAILLTAYLENDTDNAKVSSRYESQLHSLEAFVSCASRSIGTDFEIVKQVAQRTRQSWPYPHFVKVHALSKYLNKAETSHYSWIIWADADIRIINLDYPIYKLIEYAEKNDIHLIVNSPEPPFRFINNLFLIRNSEWGRKFLLVWVHFISGGKSCGNYDQCHFGLAMLQILEDHKNRNRWIPTRWRRASQRLENLAWNLGYKVEQGPLFTEFEKIENSTNRMDLPILFVPAWNDTVMMDNFVGTGLSREPTRMMSSFDALSHSWPFSIHSKYSKLFCPKGRPLSQRSLYKFNFQYRRQLSEKCTKDEMEKIEHNKNLDCWATLPQWNMSAYLSQIREVALKMKLIK